MFWISESDRIAPVYIHNGAGALGFDGLGVEENPLERFLIASDIIPISQFDDITVKTSGIDNKKASQLELLKRVRIHPDYVLNAIALLGLNIYEVIELVSALPARQARKTVISVHGTPNQIQTMLPHLTALKDKIRGVEYNPSCPNVAHTLTDDEIVECCVLLRTVFDDVRAKYDPTNLSRAIVLTKRLEDVIRYISVNSVKFGVLFPNTKSPLAKFGGGAISGKLAQKVTWKFSETLSKETAISIIWPSVWEKADIDKMVKLGARHIAFSSILLAHPFRAGSILRNLPRIEKLSAGK